MKADSRDLGPDERGTRGWLRGGVALAVVLAIAAWARVARFESTLVSGGITGQDGDAAYHLRRMMAALSDFPQIPTFDPMMNWPRGGAAPWSDGFDILGAGFGWLAGGWHSPQAAQMGLLLWPVVLGLLAVWAAMQLTREVAGPDAMTAPFAAGLLEAVAPVSIGISSFAATDHHVAESLSMLLLAVWVMRGLGAADRDEGRGRWGWELGGACAVALALWLFSGGVLYVGIAALPLGLVALLSRERRDLVGSGAPALLLGALLSALLTLPAIQGHGRPFSFMFPSLLQPALVALAGVTVVAAVTAGRLAQGRHRVLRSGIALAFVAMVVAAAWIAIPALRQEVSSAVRGFLMVRDPWLAKIEEFQSPLTAAGEGGLLGLMRHMGFLGSIAVVVFMPLAVAVAWKRGAAPALAFGWMSFALVVLMLVQVRFARIAFPFLSVALALGLLGLSRIVRARTGWGRLAGWIPGLTAAALVLGTPDYRDLLAHYPPSPVGVLDRAAQDLALGRPAEHGRGDGLLVPWEYASQLSVRSGRPVVANGFGTFLDPDSFRDVKRAYEGDEAQLVEMMERYDLGIVLGGGRVLLNHQPQPAGIPETTGTPPVLNPEYLRALHLSQLLIGGSGLPGIDLPHLERLMPVHASAAVAGKLANPLPVLWGFERVAGATLAGHGRPGERVVGEIQLTEQGRPHRYRAWTTVEADGTWRMRVALPSDLRRPTLRSGSSWTVQVGSEAPRLVSVPEKAVREGATLEVPAPP
jgi:hypothetical protein